MNIRRRPLSAAALAAVAVLGAGTLTACSGSGSGATGDGRLDVIASFYPMSFLAERIGGDHVHVTSLTTPGQEPHDLEISPKQIAAIDDSDAVLYLKNLQPSVDDAVAQSSVPTKIDAASLTTLEAHGNEVGGHAAAHDDRPGEESAGKDRTSGWTGALRAGRPGVGKAFEKADPQHAADYQKNTAALVKQLDDLDRRFRDGLAHTRSKVFVTTHAAFGYLAERYGLTEEAINGLDPDSEPSAARVRDLEHMAKADHVSTVFYETLVSDKTAKTIAHDAGLKTDVLDPIEGITAKSRGTDYFSVQNANLKALQQALGAK